MDSITNMKIIEEMLFTAKKEVKDNGRLFLLWGWLVFIAAIAEVAIYWMGWAQSSIPITSKLSIGIGGISWLILMPLGGIRTIFLTRKEKREQRVKTWFDDVMKYLWTAFGVVLFITFFMMGAKQINMFPIVISLYGLGLFVTGGVLKFRPLLVGGIISWVLAMISIFVTGENVTLCLAASVLTGYIIPGYLLNKQWKEQEHVQTT